MADRPEELQGDAQWRSAGDRIQTLLDATSVGGTLARERAEQFSQGVVGTSFEHRRHHARVPQGQADQKGGVPEDRVEPTPR